MPEKKKGKRKITDITRKKELSKKQMKGVSGGALRRVPIFKPIAPSPRPADDCNGNCMGSVPTADGEQVEI